MFNNNYNREQPPRLAVCLSPEERTSLILESREAALKIGLALLRGRGIAMQDDEIRSTVDGALCEAAARFRKTGQAEFMTYAYLFIKGSLFKSLRTASEPDVIRVELQSHEEEEESHAIQLADDPKRRPDAIASENQTVSRVVEALGVLDKRDREIWRRNALDGEKVARIARDMKLSAGRVFELRRKALRHLRDSLDDLKPTGTGE